MNDNRKNELYCNKVCFLEMPNTEIDVGYNRIFVSPDISEWPKQTFRVFDSVKKININPNISDIFINGKNELVCFESGEMYQCHDHYEREDFMGFFDSMKMPVFENDLLCYAFLKDGKITFKPACVYTNKGIWLKGDSLEIDQITNMPRLDYRPAICGAIVGHCDKFSTFGEHKEKMMNNAFLSSVKLLKTIIGQAIDAGFAEDKIE